MTISEHPNFRPDPPSAKNRAAAKPSALNSAKSFLADLLASGPRPSSDVLWEAATTGIAEKTLRRAAKSLGIETARSGERWFWLLPVKRFGQVGQGGQGGQDGQDGQVGHGQVGHRPPASRPPDPPQRTLGDFRRQRDGSPVVGRRTWGAPAMVRCAECAHAHALAEHNGYCAAADKDVRWPYARRKCAAFEP